MRKHLLCSQKIVLMRQWALTRIIPQNQPQKKNKNELNLVFSTHSPYIVNYLNLLIKAYDKNQFIAGARINFDDLAVYQVIDGGVESLLIEEQRIVNTNSLSDTINDIYNQYEELNRL